MKTNIKLVVLLSFGLGTTSLFAEPLSKGGPIRQQVKQTTVEKGACSFMAQGGQCKQVAVWTNDGKANLNRYVCPAGANTMNCPQM